MEDGTCLHLAPLVACYSGISDLEEELQISCELSVLEGSGNQSFALG